MSSVQISVQRGRFLRGRHQVHPGPWVGPGAGCPGLPGPRGGPGAAGHRGGAPAEPRQPRAVRRVRERAAVCGLPPPVLRGGAGQGEGGAVAGRGVLKHCGYMSRSVI